MAMSSRVNAKLVAAKPSLDSAPTDSAVGGYLADTGIWIEVERGRLSAADLHAIMGDAAVFVSPVSMAELTHAAELPTDEKVRVRRRDTVRRMRDKAILSIDGATGEIFGKLAYSLTRSGRGSPAHCLQDLWMAAQAIQHKLRLIAYDAKDFMGHPRAGCSCAT